MNNRALLGLFVVLIIIFASLYFLRDRVDLLGFGQFNFMRAPAPTGAQEQIATGSADIGDVDGSVTGTSQSTDTQSEAASKGGVSQIPQTGGGSDLSLTMCTPEMYAADCNTYDRAPVCGYEKIIGPDSTEGTRSLEYISACHYCRLYAPDGTLTLGGETSHAMGYQAGACAQ